LGKPAIGPLPQPADQHEIGLNPTGMLRLVWGVEKPAPAVFPKQVENL
jgi:hypothetical protein